MISRGVWVRVVAGLLLALPMACGNARRSKREVVLEKIPGGVATVVVAEGVALAHPRVRQVIDVLRPELPSSIGCAIDAALACDQLALGIGANRSFTLVVATRAEVKCPALSRVEPGVFVATFGGGEVASGAPVLAADAFARARQYLSKAPIAFAMAVPGGEAIGTAQPEPLEAWLALDTSPELAPVLELALREQLKRMGAEPTTSPFAARISIVREGPQVVARLGRAAGTEADLDLAAAVRTLRDWNRSRVATAAPPVFACPVSPVDPIVGCNAASATLTTRSLKAAVALVTGAKCSPLVTNQTVRGLRLEADVAPLGLLAGDVIVGAGGRLVTSKAILIETLARDASAGRTSLTIRRGTPEVVVHVVERRQE